MDAQPQPTLPTDLIGLAEAAKMLASHKMSVWRWVSKGLMPGFRVGSRIKVSRADVVAFAAQVQPVGVARPRTRAELAAREAEVDRVLRACGVRK